MSIVVVDNNNIITNRINDLSETYEATTFEIIIDDKTPFTESFDIWEEEYLKSHKKSDEIVFIINAHLISKDSTRLETIGVDIYKYLLYNFKDSLHNKRFIFASPFARKSLDLTNKKTALLKYFPFLKLPFDKNSLDKALKTKCRNFNLPSFNLFLGWYLSGASAIDTKLEENKKILFVDDEFSKWKETLELIFGYGKVIPLNASEIDQTKYFREQSKVNFSGCKTDFKSLNNVIAFVISDLYLTESHSDSFSSSPSNVEHISGYRLYNQLRSVDKIIPIVMLTSSNKTWNLKLFDSLGVDDYCIKSMRPDESESDLVSNYEEFRNAIRKIRSKNFINFHKISEEFYKLKEKKDKNGVKIAVDFTKFWWFKKLNSASQEQDKDEIIRIVEYCLLMAKKLLIREPAYEEFMNYDNEKLLSFLASSVIIHLAKVSEIIYSVKKLQHKTTDDQIDDHFNKFIYRLRNIAAHSSEYELITYNDLEICLSYLLTILKIENLPQQYCTTLDTFDSDKRAILYYYIRFYNQPASDLIPENKSTIYQMMVNLCQKLFNSTVELKEARYLKNRYPDFIAFPKKSNVLKMKVGNTALPLKVIFPQSNK